MNVQNKQKEETNQRGLTKNYEETESTKHRYPTEKQSFTKKSILLCKILAISPVRNLMQLHFYLFFY